MTKRHEEDKLNGVIEYALNVAMDNKEWLQNAADSDNIKQNTPGDVFRAVEHYITDHLARIVVTDGIVAYLQDADGNERTLRVTEPDPEDGTYCIHMDDEGQSWVRIVPTSK